MKKLTAFLCFFALSIPCWAAGEVAFSLTAERGEISAGSVFAAEAVFDIKKPWHIYGQNSDELGEPTTISFALPEGFLVIGSSWPKVKKFPFMGIEAEGYAGVVKIAFQIAAPAKISESKTLKMSATAKWLACSDSCVPGNGRAETEISVVKSEVSGAVESLWAILAGAFLGGMILNLMPCVFPVIGLKIMSFASSSGERRSTAVLSALAYAAGIVASFLALAGLLIVLRSFGENLGWGFQLQNPAFTAAMALLFFAMALSFAGMYEIGAGFAGGSAGVEAPSSGKKKYLSAAASGVLAVLVASPCTAPFMGTALGAALASDAPVWLAAAVFSFLGLGMASPYVLLSAIPSLARAMPRPGAWMDVFKQILSLPLFATVIWLVWVYSRQSPDAVMRILAALLILAAGLKIYANWHMPHFSKTTRLAALAACAALSVFAVWLACAVESENSAIHSATTSGGDAWSPARVEKLRAEGKAVYVDFTAAWCLTCQYNKAFLHSAETKALFKKRNIVMLTGDWTNKKPEIGDELRKFGRAGVPLNLLYSPRPDVPPIVLPAILTQAAIREAVDKIAK